MRTIFGPTWGDVVACGLGEAAGGDEDAFVGFVRGEGSDKELQLIHFPSSTTTE